MATTGKRIDIRGEDRNNLLMLLKEAQDKLGYLSHESLAELAQSAEIENEADIVLAIHPDQGARDRNEPDIPTELILLKQREGPIGSRNVTFRRRITFFAEADS